MSSSLKASKNSVTTAKSSLTIITQAEPLRCLIWLGENLAQQSVSSHTPSWPEMRAQFEDKKLPPTDFKMTVNGKVLSSISEPGKGAAVFRVKDEEEVKEIFRTMTGLAEMPTKRNHPLGVLYFHAMDDGSKATLRSFSSSEKDMGAHCKNSK